MAKGTAQIQTEPANLKVVFFSCDVDRWPMKLFDLPRTGSDLRAEWRIPRSPAQDRGWNIRLSLQTSRAEYPLSFTLKLRTEVEPADMLGWMWDWGEPTSRLTNATHDPEAANR